MQPTIVWLDDDADVLEPLIRPLERAGFRVRWYLTRADVLHEKEQLMTSAALIVDLLLPGGEMGTPGRTIRNGIEFVRELREQGYVRPIVVLSVVGKGGMQGQLQLLSQLGIRHDYLLRKPIRASLLAEKVQQAIEEHGGARL